MAMHDTQSSEQAPQDDRDRAPPSAVHQDPAAVAAGGGASRQGFTPETAAGMVQRRPEQRDAILRWLSETFGAAFVRQMFRILGAPAAATAAPEANASSPHSFTGPAHLRVTASGLNVRSAPSVQSHDNIVGGLHLGDQIEGLDRDGEWIAIMYKGQRAFVHGGFVEAIPAQVKDAHQVANNPERAPANPHEAPPPATAPTIAPPTVAAPAAAHDPAHGEVAARTSSTSTRTHHDGPAPAHHDAPAHEPAPAHAAPAAPASHAVAAHHEPANPAPAQHAEAPKATPDPALVRGHYQTLLLLVEGGALPLDAAVAQLIAFDRGLHGGQVSPTGVELVAGFPLAVAQHQVAKSSEHAAAKGSAAPPPAPQPAAPAPKTAGPAVAPAAPVHVEAPPAAKHAPVDTAWTPPAGSQLTDPHLLGLAAKVQDPRVQTLLTNIGGMLRESTLAKKQTGAGSEMEYTNAEHRDALVHSIGVVRSELEQLDGKDANVAALKVAVYHEIERIAPYHFQKNIRAIETWDKEKSKGGKRQWTTCNLTSLAMCLEVTGISAKNFPADREALLEQVAKLFEGDINEGKDDQGDFYAGAVLTAKGKGTSLEKVKGFRLPDFLELAAIVYATISGGHKQDEQGIIQGANDAANQKGQIGFLKGLAGFMGGTATGVNLVFDADAKKNAAITKKLESFGSEHRGIYTDGVEKMNTQRNLMENAAQNAAGATNAKAKKRYEKEHADAEAYYTKLDKTQHKWLDDPAIEATLPIETYKSAVTSQLGKHLDAGKGVIAGLSGHYVRLYEVTPDGVCVQDPGQWNRTEMRITWAEARAMGYFWVNLVIA